MCRGRGGSGQIETVTCESGNNCLAFPVCVWGGGMCRDTCDL